MSADGDIVRAFIESRFPGDAKAALAALARLEAAETERDELRKEVAALNSHADLSSSMFFKAQRDTLAEALRQIAHLWKESPPIVSKAPRGNIDRADSIARAALVEAGLE